LLEGKTIKEFKLEAGQHLVEENEGEKPEQRTGYTLLHSPDWDYSTTKKMAQNNTAI